jgi:oligopeptide/dipeptide ABC transporter ATP-binding protein
LLDTGRRVNPILSVENLDKRFRAGGGLLSKAGTVHAVVDASFSVPERGALGLVGESGCGKSTLARCLLRLVEPDGGRVVFEGQDIRRLARRELREVRRRMQIVFQDPYASLNPRRTVAQTLAEPLAVHGIARGAQAAERVAAALAEVGLPRDAAHRYPHEFSGGQRQRVGIARALVLEPRFIVADEPVSALDVSVQAQVLKLLEALRERRALSLLLVSHDLGVVRHVCDRVAVMYLGRIVEQAPVPEIFDAPLHPYTQMLRAASPVPDPKARFALPRVVGEIPSAMNPPPGCAFHSRCPHAMPRCREERPLLREVAPGRSAACHLL